MSIRTLFVFAIAVSPLWLATATRANKDEFAVGADISFLADSEQKGVVFKEGGQEKQALQILRDHNYNWVRLRLFHTPDRLPNNLEYTITQAKAAKKLGFKFLLDIHYSDTWADPQKQFTPRAWKDLDHDKLVDAVYSYTRDVITSFRSAGASPDMVQIGNEVIGGMLWPDGKLPNNWANFADLLKAGIRGVKAGTGDDLPPKIMVHIDRGGDQKTTKAFFDKCRELGVDYDVIGQSYYPWWHGSLEKLADNMAFMARTYDKDIMLVEVAYNWRPAEYKDRNGPFPETPEGQQAFLRSVNEIVRNTPQGRGRGIFWWEPAVPPGSLAGRGMFDQSGNALPVIDVFDALSHTENVGSGGQ
jgi:arabinogalactan endo-1,4-beta-galactosidase